ncbi:MAG: hypothetical protein NVS9B12_10890 [Vulcanimicrobiaceae bacterium]
MTDRSQHLLSALAAVQAAGSQLEPTWNPLARSGASYRGTGSELEDAQLEEQLEALAREDYLERVFVERVSLCPDCGSHAINVHEACISCASSNLTQFKALFHFRCGYVGPVTAFTKEKQGLRCPKCRKILADLGTDHESPGTYFRCRACMAMFQVPEAGARCLACSARFTAANLQEIRHHDVFAYRLTTLGTAALAEKRLQPGALADGDWTLEPREAIVEYVEEQIRIRAERGTKFGLILVGPEPEGASPVERDFGSVIRKQIPVDFRLGRLDADHLLVVIASASKSVTNATRQKIAAAGVRDGAPAFRIESVELGDIADNDSVGDALANFTRVMDIHV